MIVVKVELHSAITGKVEEIGRMHVFNKGSKSGSTQDRGNYGVHLLRRGNPSVVQRYGAVDDHPRLSAPVWQLVLKALKAVGY
jgi:hypothetical protein